MSSSSIKPEALNESLGWTTRWNISVSYVSGCGAMGRILTPHCLLGEMSICVTLGRLPGHPQKKGIVDHI